MNFLDIQIEIEKLLKPKRFQHTLNVVKEAERLCKIYDVELASGKLAALLHDCAKSFGNDKLLSYAEESNLNIDYIQRESPELLHGPVGALYANSKFGVDDKDILNAIASHTTGHGNMSKLEKIIYLADLTEEGRSFPGLDTIRDISSYNLDKALILACNCTLSYIMKKDLLLHPLTIELRNSLIIREVHNDGKSNG